jgi:putative hydrolase of the HAD superfamily
MLESPIQLIRQFSHPLTPLPVNRKELEDRFPGVPPLRYGDLPFPVVLFDLYGTLLQSASGESGAPEGSGITEFHKVREPPTLEPLSPFLPSLPRTETLQTLQRWFLKEVEKRHEVLRSTHRVPEIRVEEVWAAILGLPEEEAFEFALRYELTVNPVYPMPGAREYLACIRKKGTLLGLVSNAQSFAPFYVEALFGVSLAELGFHPTLTIFSYQWGEAKPSPQLFQAAADALGSLGYEPREALCVGNDLRNDVWAPQQVGFRAALFCGDGRSLRLYQDDPLYGNVRPDYLLESFQRGNPCM